MTKQNFGFTCLVAALALAIYAAAVGSPILAIVAVLIVWIGAG